MKLHVLMMIGIIWGLDVLGVQSQGVMEFLFDDLEGSPGSGSPSDGRQLPKELRESGLNLHQSELDQEPREEEGSGSAENLMNEPVTINQSGLTPASTTVKVTKTPTSTTTQATLAITKSGSTTARFKRSRVEDIAYLQEGKDSTHPTGQITAAERLSLGLDKGNERKTVTDLVGAPPQGVPANLLSDWNNRKWEQLTSRLDADGAKITKRRDNRPSWVPVGKMVTYDQHVTIQIVTEISPAIDAIDDLTYHLLSDVRMLSESFTNDSDPVRVLEPGKLKSLKSPRGHPSFGMGTDEPWKRVKKFPVIDFATVDHTLDISARQAQRCQSSARHALSILGPMLEPGEPVRSARSAWSGSASVGLSMITGLFGVGLFGLGGQVAQLKAQVHGLEASIPSLRRKTSALLQAEAHMKDYAHKAWTASSQKYGAIRRGLLAHVATDAACHTAANVRRAVDQVNLGQLPSEMFRSPKDIRRVVTEVKTKFLEPAGLQLVAEEDQILMRSACQGRIRKALRKKPLEVDTVTKFEKGSLGHAWEDKNGNLLTTAKDNTGMSSDEMKVGLDGNEFRRVTVHKTHKEGMRPGFLTNVLDLVVRLKLPVSKDNSQCWEQLHLDKNLYMIGGVPYELEDTRILFRSASHSGEHEYLSMDKADFKRCDAIKGHPLILCPAETIKRTGTCEEEILEGRIVADCLHKLKPWNTSVPFIQQQGRSLTYVVYVPQDLSLTITCPNNRKGWNSSSSKGLLTVVMPPFCTLYVGNHHRLAVAGMVETRSVSTFQGEVIEDALKAYAHSIDLEWGAVQEALNKVEAHHKDLQAAFNEAEEFTQESYLIYVRKFLWGISGTIMATVAIMAAVTTVTWTCVKYRRIGKVIDQRFGAENTEADPEKPTRSPESLEMEAWRSEILKDLQRRVDSMEKSQTRVDGEIRDLRRLGLSITDKALRFGVPEEGAGPRGRNQEGFGEFRSTAFQPSRIRSLLGSPNTLNRPF